MLTVEYLKTKLGACWSLQQLAEAAKLWPSDPCPWSWFLGPRLADMTHAEAMLRLHVAAAHMGVARLDVGRRPGAVLKVFRACVGSNLQRGAALLGAWLDAPEDSEALAALQAFLASPADVIDVDADTDEVET